MTQHTVVGSGQAVNAGTCPNCRSTSTVALSGFKKCNQCGEQFSQEHPASVPFVQAPETSAAGKEQCAGKYYPPKTF
jgi:hypothetical protein